MITSNIGTLRPILEALHFTHRTRRLLLDIGDRKFRSASIPAFIKFALKNRDAEWCFDQERFRITLAGLSLDTKIKADIILTQQPRQIYALVLHGTPDTSTTWSDPVTNQTYTFTFGDSGTALIYIGESKVGSGKIASDARGVKERIRQHFVWAKKYKLIGEGSAKPYPLYRFMASVPTSRIGWSVIDESGARSEAEWIELARKSGHPVLNVARGTVVSTLKD
jgi:hypothetical protein